MLNDMPRARLIGAWFAAVAVTMAGNIILGAPVTLGTSVLLLAASLVPPAILLLVERRAKTDGPQRKRIRSSNC